MKNFFVSFFIIVIVFACKTNENIDYAVLKGNIKNAISNSILIVKNGNIFKELLVDEKGNFSDTLQIDENDFFSFTINEDKFDLYLRQGDKLTFTIDDEVLIEGVGATYNNYLIEKKKLKQRELIDDSLFTLTENKFLKTINQQKEEQLKLFNNVENLDTNFLYIEEQYVKYDYYMKLYRFESDNKTIIGYELLNNIDLEDERLYKSVSSYRSLMNSYWSTVYTYPDYVDNWDAIQDKFKTIKIQQLKENIITSAMKSLIKVPDDKLEEVYTNFIEATKDEQTKADLQDLYTKLQHIGKGKPAPFFNFENYNGDKTSLTDLKGKFIYIDVWATWCIPCIKEIPALRRVENHFISQNIEFIGVSIDSQRDHDKWKNFIKSNEVKSIQLYANYEAEDSQFKEDYLIGAIPRFILLDKHGKIVDANAPRPSSPKLIPLLESLVN